MNRQAWMTLICSFGLGLGLAKAQEIQSDQMEHSTVRVIAHHSDGASEGSGFVIGDGRYVVTNYHVVANADAVKVFNRYGTVMENDVTGFVVKSPERDIAVLKLAEVSGLTPVVLGTRASVHKLQHVLAAGFPGAADNRGDSLDNMMEVRFTTGIISGFVQENGEGMYQISAAVNPGNSGGPLFDECGRVIGINSLKSLVNAVVVGADGKPTLQRVPLGENIAWAIQTDVLVDLLHSANIPVQVESTPCVPGATSRSTQETPTAAATTGTGGSNPDRNRVSTTPNETQFPTRLWLIIGAAAAFVIVVVILIIVLVRSRKPRQPQALQHSMPPHSPPPVLSSQNRSTYDGVPRLRGISGTHAGMEFPLSQDAVTMGRDPRSSQIVFQASDNLVSKRHCTVRYDRQAGGVILEDCGSMNGTFLENGERLKSGESRLLSPNGRFYLGSRNNMFQVN